jgi:hypothetical protein
MNNLNNLVNKTLDMALYDAKSQAQSQKPKKKKKLIKAKRARLSDKFLGGGGRNLSGISRTFNAPVAKTKVIRTMAPTLQYSADGKSAVMSHREFIRDIPGSVLFTTNQIAVNPGLPESFPWLSNIAPNFESYIFEALEFDFEDASNTTYTGTVMAAIDYDASDDAPLSKVQMASYEGFVRSAAWNSFANISPPRDLHKRSSYYVRTGSLAANQDIKLYDTGNFFIATQGQADTANVGELYVKYRVRFTTPQLGNIAVGLARSAKITNNVSNTIASGSNAPLTTAGLIAAGPTTLTATAPYNCLITCTGSNTVPAVVTTAASTCTIQSPATFLVGNTYLYSAELAFAPGQIFSFDIGNNATWVSTVSKVGQYNTLVL